jgi:hypothetical protein
MIDYPVELHCPAQDHDCACENKIVEDVRSTFANEYRLVITYNIRLEKHNLYYLPMYDRLYMEQDPDVIVANSSPLSLEIAQIVFPMYHFDEENYYY